MYVVVGLQSKSVLVGVLYLILVSYALAIYAHVEIVLLVYGNVKKGPIKVLSCVYSIFHL